MALTTVRTILLAAAPVTALVGQRVYPIAKDQDVTIPAVTLQRVSNTPVNHLCGSASLDEHLVQCDSWSDNYLQCVDIAAACRAALAAANIQCQAERDDYDPTTKLYRISQDFQVWL